jgi:hypothetical protein
MQLFCPDCQLAFASTHQCPKCGVRLIAPQETFVEGPVAPPAPVENDEDYSEASPSTFLGRVLVGSICSLGFLLAFRELGLAILGPRPLDVAAQCFLRFLAVGTGSLLAGAGRVNGSQTGLFVGVLVGALLTVNDMIISGGPEFWWPVGLAAGYPLVAGIGGWIGSVAWPAPVELPRVAAPAAVAASRSSQLGRLDGASPVHHHQRPTAWLRVFLGALVAFAAIVASDQIRLFLAKASIGIFNTGGSSKAAAVGAQLAGIVFLIGGIIAGANTGAGFRHGLFAALLTLVNLYVSAYVRGFPVDPPIAGLFAYLDRPFQSLLDPESAGIVALTILILVTAGGWLGGQLFPPLAPEWMRNRRLSTQI